MRFTIEECPWVRGFFLYPIEFKILISIPKLIRKYLFREWMKFLKDQQSRRGDFIFLKFQKNIIRIFAWANNNILSIAIDRNFL